MAAPRKYEGEKYERLRMYRKAWHAKQGRAQRTHAEVIARLRSMAIQPHELARALGTHPAHECTFANAGEGF